MPRSMSERCEVVDRVVYEYYFGVFIVGILKH